MDTKMNLQFNPTSRNLTSTLDVLKELEAGTGSWATSISEFIEELGVNTALNLMVDSVTVNGEALNSYFTGTQLLTLITVLKRLQDIDPQDAQRVLGDTIAMVCLIAIIKKKFIERIERDNAEDSWQKLLKNTETLEGKAKSSYERHKATYDAIFGAIQQLLPPNLHLCIKIAAVVIYIWQNRYAYAEWIRQNQGFLIGFGIGVVVGGLLGKAIFEICNPKTSNTKDDKKK